MKSSFLRADKCRVASVPVLFFGSSPCFPSLFFTLMMLFGARDGKYTRRKVNMGAKTLWRGESRKLSRVMRRGHFSKITFKGESTVSYRFKPKILQSPPPPTISNDWSHRPSEQSDNVPSPSLPYCS